MRLNEYFYICPLCLSTIKAFGQSTLVLPRKTNYTALMFLSLVVPVNKDFQYFFLLELVSRSLITV